MSLWTAGPLLVLSTTSNIHSTAHAGWELSIQPSGVQHTTWAEANSEDADMGRHQTGESLAQSGNRTTLLSQPVSQMLLSPVAAFLLTAVNRAKDKSGGVK